MQKNFKWSELEFIKPEADEQFEDVNLMDILKSFGMEDEDITIEELRGFTTFTEMDYTIVSGICQSCGNEYEWQGLFRDMPDDFCDCERKR